MFSYFGLSILIIFVDIQNAANYEKNNIATNSKNVYAEPVHKLMQKPEQSLLTKDEAENLFENRQILNKRGPKSKIVTKKELFTTTIGALKARDSAVDKQLKKTNTTVTKGSKNLIAPSESSTFIEVTSTTNMKTKKKKTSTLKASSIKRIPMSTMDSKLKVPTTVPTVSNSSKFIKENGTRTTALISTTSATETTSTFVSHLIKGNTSNVTESATSTNITKPSTSEKISTTKSEESSIMSITTSFSSSSTTMQTKPSETSTATTLSDASITQTSTTQTSTSEVYIPTIGKVTKSVPTSTSEEPLSAVTKLVFTPYGKIYMRKPTCSRSIRKVISNMKLLAFVTIIAIWIMT